MLLLRATIVAGLAVLLAACGSGEPTADINRIDQVGSSFGPEFKVTNVPSSGIDPKLLAPQKLPAGIAFTPPDCAEFAEGQLMPEGLKGNMAATFAEGEGNRFIAMAVETSEPVPSADPGENCKKVEFAGGQFRGLAETVDVPQIEGVTTRGTHRVLQTIVDRQPRTGELYNYVASFDDYLVIVTANPLVVPGKPVAPVNTQRARDLLTAAVAAVRG
ncbi:DUF5642 family protein [Mycobacterium manitobense]|uniref:DUF5642 family protein n=1 Tax=[Mycobacterium] manitobense TaxID=190147 RepID=A0A9X2YN25_9MYCO|nr:DUF5642 family protein [[Mycobacterium] manitobense]MCV7170211.1 DUF5642 family protein [[Mycobacterium] manitobense]